MDFKLFCDDFRIKTAPGDHKHNRRGWINISCPLCSGDPGYHLGYDQARGYFCCYRCGWHPIKSIISTLSGMKGDALKALLKRYKGKDLEEKKEIVRAESVVFPTGTLPMTSRHKRYLASRKFDPDYLEAFWNLKGTGEAGNYKFRVIAPIYFQGQLISYQGRDITDKQSSKYKACAEEEEVISHKYILYGWDQVPADQKTCLVVEGVTGVWRFGAGSLATFGVEYTHSQIRLLACRFDKIYTLSDPDEAGERMMNKITTDLLVMGKEVVSLEFSEKHFDSGNLPQSTATAMMDKIRTGLL